MKQKFRQLGTKVSPHETSAKPTESNFYIISYCMMTKRLYILIVGLAMNVVAFAQSSLLPYKNPVLSVDERVKDLLSRMTLEEKVGQLLCPLGWEMYEIKDDEVHPSEKFKRLMKEKNAGMLWATYRADPWTKKTLENGLNPELAAKAGNALQKYVIENTRLGIPLFLAEEAPHGHMAIGTTVFPTGIGMAATWSPVLIEEVGNVIAKEIRSQGAHISYGPVLDLSRDPRWSRVEEGFGEDTYLSGELGKAVVEGMQNNPAYPIISTVKHFTAYGWTEGGHNGGAAHIGENEMQEVVLPSFRKVVEAGLLSLMTSYNEVDGVPCTGNKKLITDLVKDTWGFKGFVVSDLFSIDGMTGHGVAGNLKEAADLAFQAGVESDLGGQAYRKLPELVKEGKVSEQQIDEAVKKILRLKFQWKLFDEPFTNPNNELSKAELNEHRALAREVARQSIVLLKNENQTLPLQKDKIRSIAVIGPNADTPYNMLGDYTAPQPDGSVITVLDGIKNALPNAEVNYAKGCAIRDMSDEGMAEAKATAEKSDIIVLVLGGSSARDFSAEFEATGAAKASRNELSDMDSGEGNDRCTLDLLGRQNELLDLMKETGKPLVVVLIKGRPLAVGNCQEKADAMLDAWYPGAEGGNAIADVLFGDYNPAGRLAVSVPKNVGQLPVFYNPKRGSNRRGYIEGDANPLYPFGYGLSYTTFSYDNVKVIPTDSQIKVTVTVTNTGKYDGDEVIQIYVKDVVSSHSTPEKNLKAFKREHFKAGESKDVELLVNKKELELYQGNGKWKLEPGEFEFMIGNSSESLPLKISISL